jgi:S1-C subfamily serine protease
MRQAFQFILAGIFGGLVTLGGSMYFLKNRSLSTEPAEQVGKLVNFTPPTTSIVSTYAPTDFTQAAEIATKAVVNITAKVTEKQSSTRNRNVPNDMFHRFFGEDNPLFGFEGPQEGTGSGVIYTSDGYIITNNHVVDFADEFEVTTFNNEKYKAKLIGKYEDGDLAVLKIDAKNLSTLLPANSDEAKIGQWVLAVGNPMNLRSTVTAGIISAKGRDINIIQGKAPIESFIQTDAVVNPGNSGGALVDTDGRLLGINTAIATKTGWFEGYSFAIPINLVKRIVDDLIANGSYERGFLGVNILNLDSETAKELGLKITQGVVVESLIDGGAAQYSGLQPQDVIVEANGKSVKTVPDLLEIVGSSKVGQTVNLVVNRKGSLKNIPVKLKAGT